MAQLLIGGVWRNSGDGGHRTIICPADGSTIATVDEATADDARAAIAAARTAFDDGPWPHTPAPDRAALLHGLADRLTAERERVARLEALDTGKRMVEARMDMDDIVAAFRHFANLAQGHAGRVIDTGTPNVSSRIVHEPVGVCSLITPWNFPLLQTAWKVAPALAAGNTFVLKPSELTPHTAIWLLHTLTDLGLPDGVGNLVLGAGPTVGAPLTEDPRVDLVSFTGGIVTGRAIMAAAAPTVKRIALELGGKNPNIIFADADLDAAIDNALTAVFLDSGQVCSAGARLIVEESVHDRVVPEIVRRAADIRMGGPFDEAAETGPLISADHRAAVERYVADAVAEGAQLLVGGSAPDDPALADGFYFSPTVLGGCHSGMRCVQQESFGPVLTVETFTGVDRDHAEDAAVALANDTIYGLAGAVWTENAGRAERVASRLRHGTIWINDYHPYAPQAEWGGYKQSGIGRELGVAGLAEYVETKHIWHHTRPTASGWFVDRARSAEHPGGGSAEHAGGGPASPP